MTIIAIANQKGGVGKTTTAAALGAAWVDTGRRVLWVDLDPQASLTSALGQQAGHALYRLFEDYIETGDVPDVAAAIQHLPDGGDLLPAHLDLAATEQISLAGTERREYVLSDLLEPIAGRYDVVVIDCPPALGLLVTNALTAADSVLIPCTPEYLAAEGLARLLATITKIRKRLNPHLQIAGVLPTMVKPQTVHHRAVLAQIQDLCAGWARDVGGAPLLASIPDRISVADAAGQGIPVTRYAEGNGAADVYRAIARQLAPPEVRRAR